MGKSPEAFRTIREVSEWLDTPAHVLRFWESKFSQIRPVKRAGGRRYYRPNDMLLLGGIKRLLHEDGHTIKGVQRMLGTDGIKSVAAMSQPLKDNKTEIKAEVESPAVVSFVSNRASKSQPQRSDLSDVEDAELIAVESDASDEAPIIPDIDVPADPADREFDDLAAPITAAILTGRLKIDGDQQRATVQSVITNLIDLRDRQGQDRLL